MLLPAAHSWNWMSFKAQTSLALTSLILSLNLQLLGHRYPKLYTLARANPDCWPAQPHGQEEGDVPAKLNDSNQHTPAPAADQSLSAPPGCNQELLQECIFPSQMQTEKCITARASQNYQSPCQARAKAFQETTRKREGC